MRRRSFERLFFRRSFSLSGAPALLRLNRAGFSLPATSVGRAEVGENQGAVFFMRRLLQRLASGVVFGRWSRWGVVGQSGNRRTTPMATTPGAFFVSQQTRDNKAHALPCGARGRRAREQFNGVAECS